MPALDDIVSQKMQLLHVKKHARQLHPTLQETSVHVVRGGKRLISFSSNDYLGLTRHPQVIAAAQKAIDIYGTGAGASRLITGNHPLYEALEAKLASYKHTQSACVFGSGYLTNIGVIPALVGKADLIIIDRLSHACMLDGVRLSGASYYRYSHNNLQHLQQLLEEYRAEYANCLILTESIFSMDGDKAPIHALAALAARYDCWLMIDGAHDLGSSPISQSESIIYMGTLSKALGNYGGYVCGSQTLIDYLKTAVRSLIFSTGLPPSVVAGAIAALEVMEQQPELCEIPIAHATYFTEQLGLPVAESAIVPLMLGAEEDALRAQQLLEEHGFLVHAIRPPTVPPGTSRLRFTFSAAHTKQEVQQLIDVMVKENICPAPLP